MLFFKVDKNSDQYHFRTLSCFQEDINTEVWKKQINQNKSKMITITATMKTQNMRVSALNFQTNTSFTHFLTFIILGWPVSYYFLSRHFKSSIFCIIHKINLHVQSMNTFTIYSLSHHYEIWWFSIINNSKIPNSKITNDITHN